MSVAIALVAAPVFSVVKADEAWRDGVLTVANWRQGITYLSTDAGNALTVSLADQNTVSLDTGTLTMSWTNTEVVYSLTDEVLLRTVNGSSQAVSRGVAGAEITRNGSLLIVELTMVHASATVDARAALRELGP